MTAWQKFVSWLAPYGKAPETFGVFHIIFLVLFIAIFTLIIVFRKKITKKISFYLLLSIWIVMFVAEVFKLLALNVYYYEDPDTGKVTTHWLGFIWTHFPFQFCSMPLYFLPLVLFLKDSIIKRRIELFSCLFFVVGGLPAIFLPDWYNITWLNYHTMAYHGLMVCASLLIAFQIKDEFKMINLAQSFLITVPLMCIAQFLNWIIPKYQPMARDPEFTLNMFHISYRYRCPLPILDKIWGNTPGRYMLFLFTFIFGLALCFFIFYVIYSLLNNHRVDFSFKRYKKQNG